MYHFIKNLVAAAILFASLITSVALSYALTSGESAKPQQPVKVKASLTVKKKQAGSHFNDSLNILIPKVKS
jgi:hypothetical protein